VYGTPKGLKEVREAPPENAHPQTCKKGENKGDQSPQIQNPRGGLPHPKIGQRKVTQMKGHKFNPQRRIRTS